MKRRGSVIAVAVLLLAPVTQWTEVAYAHDAVNFSVIRFRAAEGDRNEPVTVVRGTHGDGPASVDLVAAAGTATAGADFQASTQRIFFTTPVESAEAFVGLYDDAEIEDPETISLLLQDPSAGMVLAFPNRTLLTLVDDDGASRLSVEEPERAVFETARSIALWVIRSGDAANSATVSYATQDVTAVAGTDYGASSGTLTFASGERWKRVLVPITDDERSDGNLDFDFLISAPEGALLTEAPSTRVTIRDDESDTSGDSVAPYTAFHQPLDGESYGAKTARDFLIFMQDNEGGSGMASVRMALRKTKLGGHCAWWMGRRFKAASCDKVRWSRQQPDLYTDLAFFGLVKALSASTRRNGIRFYTAYSQGIDKVGNVQKKMIKGQSKNRFEVK